MDPQYRRCYPHHSTRVYLSPDSKVPTSEIKDLYTTLNNNFHTPSPHSSQNLHRQHYHILTGDFNSWVGTQQEEHLINHSGFPHIPIRIVDPHPQRQPQGRVPLLCKFLTNVILLNLLCKFLTNVILFFPTVLFCPFLIFCAPFYQPI